MITGDLKINIFSPGKTLASVTAKELNLPGSLGYMGILPGHAPLIAELGIGALEIKYEDASRSQFYFISGGYLEVLDDTVTVLAEVIERPEDIDADRAKKAEERALSRLSKSGETPNLDVERAQAALCRALARQNLIYSKLGLKTSH